MDTRRLAGDCESGGMTRLLTALALALAFAAYLAAGYAFCREWAR